MSFILFQEKERENLTIILRTLHFVFELNGRLYTVQHLPLSDHLICLLKM